MIEPGTYQPPPRPSAEQPPAKRGCGCGCLAMGCLSLMVIALLAIAALAMVARSSIYSVTDDKPLEFAAASVSAAELDAVTQKVQTFAAGLRGQESVAPLVLSEQELNAAFAHLPALSLLGETKRVRMSGSRIECSVSLPLPWWSSMSGRYLNFTLDGEFGFSKGVFLVNLQSFSHKGQKVSQAFIDGFRSSNFEQSLNQNPSLQAALRRIESIEIKDGKLIVSAKPGP